MKYNKPRGTQDIYGSSSKRLEYFTSIIKKVTQKYKYDQIITPTFENSDLYIRSIGEDSDIVQKEFYTFKDKSERNLALRPEGTVGVIRAVLENNLINSQNINNNIKLYYLSNFFRYERPQKGRYREFFQFGLESISSHKYLSAIEVLKINKEILDILDIKYIIKINYIGSSLQRKKWMEKLQYFFEQNKENLEPHSISRISTNPLRILDDKLENNKTFMKLAPSIDEFLSFEDKDYIKNIKQDLVNFNIDFTWDHNLIRGLDYYNGVVFEILDKESNLTLVGGGYYSDLVSELSDNKIEANCFGSGMGIDRVLEIAKIDLNNKKAKVYIGNICKEAVKIAFYIRDIISNYCEVDTNLDYNMTFKKVIKKSDEFNSDYLILIGQKEVETNIFNIKNLSSKQSKDVSFDELISFFKGDKYE